MREDSHTEFKEQYTGRILKAAVAFANTEGGSIYLGIDDDGEAVGVADPDSEIRNTTQHIIDGIRPDMMSLVRSSFEDIDGKTVVRFQISEGSSKPYYLREKGLRPEGVFIRSGAMNVPASSDTILKMVREWSSRPYESCLSMEQDLSFDHITRIFDENGLQLGREQMRSFGFFDDGQYTNLAYLLSDQCEIGIRFASYDDESKKVIRGRHEFYGCVVKQFEDVLEYLNMYNPATTTVDGSSAHKDTRPFPSVALREALLNAIVHRDYSINGPILVSVFDSRIEIVSLGGLNRDLGPDDLLLGVSSLRNPKLAAVFYRIRMIESYGTGIPKIMGCYDGYPMKPMIELSTNAFKMTVPRITEGMDSERMKVIEMIRSGGSVSRKDVEEGLGVSRAKANQILQEMVGDGQIRMEGSARSTRYTM